MAYVPATAQSVQVLQASQALQAKPELSTIHVAGKPAFGLLELNPGTVQRTLDAQREAELPRRQEQQRLFEKRQRVERNSTSSRPLPKPTTGQLTYAVLPDGSIALRAHALDYDRA